jgi:glutathione peroxidase
LTAALQMRTVIVKSEGADMSIYEFRATTIDGAEQSMQEYHDQVLLIVNVASKCGFTPQYAGLEALYRKLHPRGFSILGFPCDQFGQQEPGNEQEIRTFCSTNYDVTFPMFAKIEVNGAHAHPLYKYLKQQQPGILNSEAIKWNFTKFLVNRNGEAVKRFGSVDKPEAIEKDITPLLV